MGVASNIIFVLKSKSNSGAWNWDFRLKSITHIDNFECGDP